MKKATLILFLLTMYINGWCQYGGVSFYVVGHPDQWQLFMGETAYNDITSANGQPNKVVFIYVSAGDESCNGALNVSKYTAREESAHNCTEFCADIAASHSQWQNEHTLINGHSILKYTYSNVVSYCLRLPDGCSGHSITGQSLQMLHDGAIPSITSVDSAATYTGWADLTATINRIIVKERDNIPVTLINTAETDNSLNNGDDPDHIYTGMLCMAATDSMTHLAINLFRENAVAALPTNLDDISIATKAALLSQLDYVITESGLPSEWTPQNISYLSRSYFRTITK